MVMMLHDGPSKESDFYAEVFCKDWLVVFQCVIPSDLVGLASMVALSDKRDIEALLSAWPASDGFRWTPMRQICRHWFA